MNEVETLKGVRDLLSDPKRWTKGSFARTKITKRSIGPTEANAACWCIRGAVIKIAGDDGDGRAVEVALCKALRTIQGAPFIEADPAALARFNDEPHCRHEEVMKVIDLAIKTEEAKSHGTEA